MAMKTGKVTCLQIADDYAFTTVEGGGTKETFILWWFPGTGGGIPADLTSYTRIMHSMWVSILREARASNLTVQITTLTGSAAVSIVQSGTL